MQLRIWIGVNSMITSGNLNLLKVIGKLLDNGPDQNLIEEQICVHVSLWLSFFCFSLKIKRRKKNKDEEWETIPMVCVNVDFVFNLKKLKYSYETIIYIFHWTVSSKLSGNQVCVFHCAGFSEYTCAHLQRTTGRPSL